jgi:hypothetical protein
VGSIADMGPLTKSEKENLVSSANRTTILVSPTRVIVMTIVNSYANRVQLESLHVTKAYYTDHNLPTIYTGQFKKIILSTTQRLLFLHNKDSP